MPNDLPFTLGIPRVPGSEYTHDCPPACFPAVSFAATRLEGILTISLCAALAFGGTSSGEFHCRGSKMAVIRRKSS